MIEMLFAIGIFALGAAGLGLGLALGRDAPRTSCGAAARHAGARCADCPLRHAGDAEPGS
ncbi:hypothetical protein [Pseudoponticoccus marisrubri]|uniref:Uncharacterized protein n=1 Tax=Pseudoponticoccus marisrubri TaxID=1685382 RepID=A0A0W7WKJ7_9RHOB|nr:hypothetical protein [Pseudoponticoccus marisrubri]KUF11132.1 hypothetical protein AVJ23_08740 [Pseudoponticoccus marisrubri]